MSKFVWSCVFCFFRQGVFKSFHDTIIFLIGVFCVCHHMGINVCWEVKRLGCGLIKTGLKIVPEIEATFFMFSKVRSFLANLENYDLDD